MAFEESRNDNRIYDLVLSLHKRFDSLERKVKDIESDQRTDVSISRAVREMGIFRKDRSSSPLKGNAFLEEIKDDY